MDKLRELHPRSFFLETWKTLDQERVVSTDKYDYRPIITLLTGALVLTMMEYWGDFRSLRWLLANTPLGEYEQALLGGKWRALVIHGYWALWRVLGYFVIPVFVIKAQRRTIRENGLETKGFLDHLWIYFLAYVVVLICVVAVSFDTHFTNYYPFYRLSHRSWFDLISWELLYAAQFFSLEFFFRGWWLQSGKKIMGSHAIFVMTVPYVMIHFGKPMLETVGAIIAGVVLGTLAMKTRSIWSGFLIHVSVALSMDFASLIQRGVWPQSFWPQ